MPEVTLTQASQIVGKKRGQKGGRTTANQVLVMATRGSIPQMEPAENPRSLSIRGQVLASLAWNATPPHNEGIPNR